MGLVCMFDLFIQRPKKVILKGFVRIMVGNRADWNKKVRRRIRRIRRTKRGRVEFRER